MSNQPELNLIEKVIAWERGQKAQGVELGSTIEAYVNEIAQAIAESKLEVAKMTHAERLAQLRRNASSEIMP